MSSVITTDSPLNAAQQDKLAALLDAIIPANEEKSLPSAKELDLTAYLSDQAADFTPLLIHGLDREARSARRRRPHPTRPARQRRRWASAPARSPGRRIGPNLPG